jgi:TolB protein
MRILLFIFFLGFPLFANDEITVHLTTQNNLAPLFIHSIAESGSGFEKNYLAALEKVVRFDFDHNGVTQICSSPNGSATLDILIDQKKLSMKLTRGKISKGVDQIVLTGDLNKDRQTLHRIHDTLLGALYDAKGVASARVIYTVKTRKTDQSSQWVSDVWEADYDGANARQTTQENCLIVTPTFVPAKEGSRARHFLYVSYKGGQPKIFAAALGEAAGKRLTYLRGNQLMPAISPTLDKMAFISDITGNPDLFVQDFSLEKGLLGTPRQVFCAPSATQGSPTFSPEGKKLAFVSNKDGTPRIYILDIPEAGTSVKNLKPKMITKKTRDNTCPAWSPDGKKIAYSAMASGTRQIWVYNLETGEEIQLTDGNGHKENPAWAPNSLHLLFNSCTANFAELYMINLNQKKAVKITSGPGEKRFPSWEPNLK